MSADVDIDELLKQDEAELRAKKKRLKTFATALDELRAAAKKAADAAGEVIDSGDLTRGDFAKVFALTKGERASLFPASPRRGVATLSDDLGDSADASNAPSDERPDEPTDGDSDAS